MKTIDERLAIVRKIANRLRKKHHLTLPVDLEKLAELEHIKIEYYHSQSGIDGYANLDCNQPVIYINEEQEYLRRKRFTMAHEIGHVRIAWHTDAAHCVTDDPYVYVQSKKKIDSQEYEANVFASELLIPSDWLKEQLSRMQDFSTFLNAIVTQTNASVMACLYALENVLPAGHIVFITTDAMEYWKSFRSGNILSSWAGCLNPFQLLDNICIDKQHFSRGSYHIRYYKLHPCPTHDQIRSTYDACDRNFGVMLNTLTEGHPERLLHSLKLVMAHIHDPIYVFLEPYEGNQVARYRTEECHISPRSEDSNYDSIATILDKSGMAREEILLAGGKRLSWVKEILYKEPHFDRTDSKQLLKALVNKYYDQQKALHILQHVNGVISIHCNHGISSRADVFTALKTRFSQDDEVQPLYSDPQFDSFLSNKISEIIIRRNTKR